MFTFVETLLFTRLVGKYLLDEEYASLQSALVENPEEGKVISGSGGVRKLRWASRGRGKRGGVRVIYLSRVGREEIWMLTIYRKNVADNIPAHILRKIRKEIEDE
ncbi:MAG: type II toxin-antitoxin system RelE/ParE family toxin [Rhodothermia bacterium]